jgi:hypothetical protein
MRGILEPLAAADGRLLGTLQNWFYGNLRVYALNPEGDAYKKLAKSGFGLDHAGSQ